MNIVHVTDRFPGLHAKYGGAEQAALRAVELLNEEPGFSNTVFTIKPDKIPEYGRRYKTKALKSAEYYLPKRIAALISGLKSKGTPFDPVSFISSYFGFRRERPDIVHIHKSTILSFSVMQSAILLGIPVVFSVYDYWSVCPAGFLLHRGGNSCRLFFGWHCLRCDSLRKPLWLSRFMLLTRFRPVFDYYYRHIRAFVALSDASAAVLSAYGINKEKICVIPQAIPLKEYSGVVNNGREADFRVFFAGWMDNKKGLHILIRAASRVIKSVPSVRFHVFAIPADNEYGEDIIKSIEENGLKGHISIFSRVNQDELREKLRNCDCVIVPEQWENMSPVIIAEAMASAKAVVASKIGGIAEFIQDGENGFLVDSKDADAFADRIIWMARNKEKTLEMGTNGRAKALSIFDREKILNSYRSLYNQCLAGMVMPKDR